jgi:hypothetical protein
MSIQKQREIESTELVAGREFYKRAHTYFFIVKCEIAFLHPHSSSSVLEHSERPKVEDSFARSIGGKEITGVFD